MIEQRNSRKKFKVQSSEFVVVQSSKFIVQSKNTEHRTPNYEPRTPNFQPRTILLLRYCAIFSCFLLFAVGCGKSKPPSAPPLPPPKVEAFVPPPKIEFVKYDYKGEKFPDPFIQLAAHSRSMVQELVIPNINSLFLKGIYIAGDQKLSLLTGGGQSYVAKGTNLYDSRGRIVPGFYCVQKAESIVVKSGDISREIKLRE